MGAGDKVSPGVELNKIRSNLLKSKGTGTRRAGTLLFIIGGFLMILGYFTKYFFFEVDAIVSLLVGILLVYSDSETYLRKDVTVAGVVSAYTTLSNAIGPMEGVHSARYTVAGNPKTVVLVLGQEDNGSGPQSPVDTSARGDNFFSPPGRELASLVREELGDIKSLGTEALTRALPRVLVDSFHLAESAEFEVKSPNVRLLLKESVFGALFEGNTKKAASILGCPICSAVAELLVEAEGKNLDFGCGIDQLTGDITADFSFIDGPGGPPR